MSIQRLPVELIEQIIEQISPGSHLSFALTSKRHLKCSQRILSHHRKFAQGHREITDVFDVPAKPEYSVEAWHKPACVVYRSVSILPALQIPDLLSLEVRHFDDPHRRPGFDFDPSAVPNDCKSSIQVLCFSAVRSVSEDQVKTLLRSIEALKVIKIKNAPSKPQTSWWSWPPSIMQSRSKSFTLTRLSTYIAETTADSTIHRVSAAFRTSAISWWMSMIFTVTPLSFANNSRPWRTLNTCKKLWLRCSYLRSSVSRYAECGAMENQTKPSWKIFDIAIAGALEARDVSNLRL